MLLSVTAHVLKRALLSNIAQNIEDRLRPRRPQPFVRSNSKPPEQGTVSLVVGRGVLL